ncbi:MAG: flagellar hook-length control protein FliK [Gammaproteobacteria bacterium]
MDIKPPLQSINESSLARIKAILPAWKAGQIIEANVVETDPVRNILTLVQGGRFLQLQSNRTLTATAGDRLALQVLRLDPVPEFKLAAPIQKSTDLQSNAVGGRQTPDIVLKLIVNAPEAKGVRLTDAVPTRAAGVPMTQTLTVKVLAVSGQKLRVQLPEGVGGQTLKPLTLLVENGPAATIKPGQAIVLELSVPAADSESAGVDSDRADAVTALVKRYLPIHESPVRLVEHLLALMPALKSGERVPEALRRLAEEIMQNLPRQAQLTRGETLRQAVQVSGLFREAESAVSAQRPGEPMPSHDLKTQLTKLIEHIRHALMPSNEVTMTPAERKQLEELLQKAETGVAKMVLDQLASLPKEDGTQIWRFDIPFIKDEKAALLKLAIEREQHRSGPPGDSAWSVTVTITPPNLGTVHCKVSYLDGVVNTHFWSQEGSVARLIENNIEFLRRQLEAAGLKTGLMDAHEGMPAQLAVHGLGSERLLDEKA